MSYYFTYFTWLRFLFDIGTHSGDHVVNHSTSINRRLSSAPPEVIALVERASRVPDRHGDLLGIWPWCRKKTRVEDGSIMYYLLYQYTNILQTSSDFEVTKGWSYGSYIDLISMKYVEVALFVSTLFAGRRLRRCRLRPMRIVRHWWMSSQRHAPW